MAEHLGRADHAVVDPVRHGLEHGEAAPVGRPAVSMDIDRDVRVRAVDDLRARRHARPHAVVAVAREHNLGALSAQVGGEVLGNVEVELRLCIAAVGFRACRIAVLVFAPVPDWIVDVARVCVVAPVVAGVDAHDLARQRERGGGRLFGLGVRGCACHR